jgi:hypothetical protein
MKDEIEKKEDETELEPTPKPKKEKPIEEPKKEFVRGFLQSLADFWGFK